MPATPDTSTILISTPFPVDSPMGNSVSARRIAGIARESGRRTEVIRGFAGQTGDALIALHAVKSAAALAAFKAAHPDRPAILILPGSDLYRDLPGGDESGFRSLALADRLAVAQEASLADVPAAFREKCRVVPKSVDLPAGLVRYAPVPPHPAPFVARMFAHVRAQKDPLTAARAAALLPPDSPVRIEHFGAAAEPDLATALRAAAGGGRAYRLHGPVARGEALRLLASAGVALNSSLMEGGANAIAEAIALGTPVVATAIPGNIGLLGPGYAGLYPPGDAAALAALLTRCAEDRAFTDQLARQLSDRRPLFTREAESAAWQALLGEIGV